jgi:hypothetical protein
MADVRVRHEGSLVMVGGVTEAGEAWLREHVVSKPWQEWGGAIAWEHRYVVAVIDAMVEDGLEVAFE